MEIGSFGRRPALATVRAVAAELGTLVGARPTEQAAIGEFDHTGFLEAGGGPRRQGPPVVGFLPGLAFVLRQIPKRDGPHIERAVALRVGAARAMEAHGRDEAAALKLNDTVVVQHEVPGGIAHMAWFGPSLRFVGGHPHDWPAIQQAVLGEIEQGDWPAAQPQ